MTTNNAVNVGLSGSTGTGNFVGSTSPSLTTPALGTPTAGVLSSCTGYPTSALTGLGTGVATFLATPSSANLLTAMTTSTGTGNLAFATSPTFVTPLLGTPTSGVLTNCTGLPSAAVVGIATNTLAGAGVPGQVIKSTIAFASSVSLSNGTPANLTSISLTAGNWLIMANLSFTIGGTCTAINGTIGPNTGAFGDYSLTSTIAAPFTGSSSIIAPAQTLSLSTPTTYYAVAVAAFSSSTVTVCGQLIAIRTS